MIVRKIYRLIFRVFFSHPFGKMSVLKKVWSMLRFQVVFLSKVHNLVNSKFRVEIFGTHVLKWTGRVHNDTLDLEAMILHEIYLFLGPLKYTSFLKVTFLKLM